MDYREKLKRRQRQEINSKGKTGLDRIEVLDYTKTNLPVNEFQVRRGVGSQGENAIDIMPFRITQKWYEKLRMPSGLPIGLGVGDLDYKLQIPVHRGMGLNNSDTYLCLREAFGKSCARCEEMFECYKNGDKEGGKKLKTQWLCFYNIFDYNDQEKGYQLWRIAYYLFEATTTMDPQRTCLLDAQSFDSDGLVLFWDLQEGKTLIAKFKERKMGENPFPEVYDIKFEDRESYDESVLDQVYPLDSMLIIPDYETVRNAHFGIEGEESNNNDVPEESLSSTTRTRRREQIQQEQIQQEHIKEKVEAPKWDKKGEWGQCPAGGKWGIDTNELSQCQEENGVCTEEHFDNCLEAKQSNIAKEESVEKKSETKTRIRTRKRR